MNKFESKAPRPSFDAAKEYMAAKRKSFLEMSLKLRERTKGRVRIPSEVLIREDRDSGYRNI